MKTADFKGKVHSSRDPIRDNNKDITYTPVIEIECRVNIEGLKLG